MALTEPSLSSLQTPAGFVVDGRRDDQHSSDRPGSSQPPAGFQPMARQEPCTPVAYSPEGRFSSRMLGYHQITQYWEALPTPQETEEGAVGSDLVSPKVMGGGGSRHPFLV